MDKKLLKVYPRPLKSGRRHGEIKEFDYFKNASVESRDIRRLAAEMSRAGFTADLEIPARTASPARDKHGLTDSLSQHVELC